MRPPASRLSRSWPGFDQLESRQLLDGGASQLLAEARPAVRHPNDSNLVYTTDASGSHRLDVHLPGGTAPSGGWPVVVAIHGGGWRGGDKTIYETTVDPTLLAAGFAVVAPDYTLSTPGHPTWPENLDELRQAVRWVKTNTAKFDFDPARVAAMGESAGAHLALMLGTDPGSHAADRVDAVVDFYGPTDLPALYQNRPAELAVTQFLGGTPSEFPSRYANASPITHVSSATPPVLIVQGTADLKVPPAQSDELAQALTSDGVPNQLISVPGAPHGFGLVVNGIDLRPAVVGFLDQTIGAGKGSLYDEVDTTGSS
jgi:acetyl esterase/lipase